MAAGGRCGAAGWALPAALLLLLLGAAASPRSSSCHHRPPGGGEVRPARLGRGGKLGGWGRRGREENKRGGCGGAHGFAPRRQVVYGVPLAEDRLVRRDVGQRLRIKIVYDRSVEE